MTGEQISKKRVQRILVCFLIFLLLMGVCTLISRTVYAYQLPIVSTVLPQTKYVEHKVEAEGIVQAGGEKPVTCLSGLRIDTIAVRTGDRVEEGDELFRIDLSDLAELMADKSDEIAQTTLQIDTILANQQIAQQKKELELARAREDYDTTARLQDTQVGRAAEEYVQAEEEMEETGAGEESSQSLQEAAYGEADARAARDAAVKEAGRKVEDILLPETESAELALYRLELADRQAALARYESILDAGGIVTASTAGVVTDIAVSAGDRIPDTAVLLLSDETVPCRFKTTLTADQKKYVSLGDTATLNLEGTGRLDVKITYLAESRTAPGSYEVLIELPEGTGVPGVSGSLSCSDPGEKYDCCLSPAAIHEKDGRKFVYVLKEREGILGMEYYVDQVNVTVLDENDSWAAIDAVALDGESKVILSATREFQKGDTVRWEK